MHKTRYKRAEALINPARSNNNQQRSKYILPRSKGILAGSNDILMSSKDILMRSTGILMFKSRCYASKHECYRNGGFCSIQQIRNSTGLGLSFDMVFGNTYADYLPAPARL